MCPGTCGSRENKEKKNHIRGVDLKPEFIPCNNSSWCVSKANWFVSVMGNRLVIIMIKNRTFASRVAFLGIFCHEFVWIL